MLIFFWKTDYKKCL